MGERDRICKCQEVDAGAFEELVRRHQRMVRALTKDSALAFLCASYVLWTASTASYGEVAPTKLAIVDVGSQEKVPPAFLDSLLVGFPTQPGIALVERTDMRRILNEQACSLAMSGRIESQCAIKVGKLCAADAFLMLEAGKDPTNNSIPVRLRLVDAHYGVRAWDSALLLDGKPESFARQAESLARQCAQRLLEL